MNETLFYVFGIALALSAVVFSFIGLKAKNIPSKAIPVVIAWFLILAGGAATFAVLHAQDEKEHKAHELEHAGKEIEAEQTSEPFEEEEAERPEGGAEEHEGDAGGAEKAKGGGEAAGPGGTLEVVANESALAYEESSLETESGKVTVEFNNPGSIPHDVAIEQDGKEIAATEVVAGGESSTTAELAPGEYTFFCSVPGHREAGMEGPLTVK